MSDEIHGPASGQVQTSGFWIIKFIEDAKEVFYTLECDIPCFDITGYVLNSEKVEFYENKAVASERLSQIGDVIELENGC